MFDTTEALCKEIGTEIFFPDLSESYLSYYAKRVCNKCPIINECRDYAIANPELIGIWGGTSARQRDQIRRDNGRRIQPRKAS